MHSLITASKTKLHSLQAPSFAAPSTYPRFILYDGHPNFRIPPQEGHAGLISIVENVPVLIGHAQYRDVE
jgi:hypothetical protein